MISTTPDIVGDAFRSFWLLASYVAYLMLWWYGDTAEAESKRRAQELAAGGDSAGVAICRIISAIGQLEDTTLSGPPHGT
jgi:hypothetical protein